MENKEINMAVYSENMEMQISEVDMVQSMYSKPGEFLMDDPSILADMRNFLEGKEYTFPIRKLEYSVNLKIDEKKFEIYCTLPPEYPVAEPEIYVRCSCLTRELQHQLNKNLSAYINSMDRGELCVGPILQWLQDNEHLYPVSNTIPQKLLTKHSSEVEEDNTNFIRLWIYSHHIYNKGKRKAILELSKDLNISGFCLPGKPGLICAEGLSRNCEEFWNRLKHMNWKKIMCKQQECIPCHEMGIDNLRRFTSFEEIAFERPRTAARDYHADMGEFYKYLEIHDCGYAFKDYFGISDIK